jgi:hypothetical protein
MTQANPFADPIPLTVCTKCGSTEYRDREIHNGQSQMRECARCNYTMGIPLWYGEPAQAQHVAINPDAPTSHGPNGRLR